MLWRAEARRSKKKTVGLCRAAPDGRPPVGNNVKLWMGDSRGHWEGNTLVVDVTNFNEGTWFDAHASFHSDALHVVERWTMVSADRIDYEGTSRPSTAGIIGLP